MKVKFIVEAENEVLTYVHRVFQASLCLHEEGAVYPRRIQFVNSPPHLALEALEMFYRIHTGVAKVLLSGRHVTPEELTMLEKALTQARTSHFARGEEKKHQMKENK